jgi:hypothetical protein
MLCNYVINIMFYYFFLSNHIQHLIIKENLEKQFDLRIKSILKSKLNGNM